MTNCEIQSYENEETLQGAFTVRLGHWTQNYESWLEALSQANKINWKMNKFSPCLWNRPSSKMFQRCICSDKTKIEKDKNIIYQK